MLKCLTLMAAEILFELFAKKDCSVQHPEVSGPAPNLKSESRCFLHKSSPGTIRVFR